jgi:hypothetical protein
LKKKLEAFPIVSYLSADGVWSPTIFETFKNVS